MLGALQRQRRETTDLVTRYGVPALLRRREGDRPCQIFMSAFSPVEMLGREAEPTTRRVLVAATPEVLALPPDMSLDRLITLDQSTSPPTELENLRLTEPPTTTAPNGETAFWRLAVRR